MTTLWIIVAVLALGATAFFTLSGFGETYRKYHAERVLDCPENRQRVVVRVNNLRAAETVALTGDPIVRLDRCSRWPEKADCDQACLASYPNAPIVSQAEAFLIEYPDMIVDRHPIPTPVHAIPPSMAVY